jgi:hypothetical protein
LRVPVVHQRALIQVGPEAFLVLDRLQSLRPHDYRLHWMLGDFPMDYRGNDSRITLKTEVGPYNIAWGNSVGPGVDSVVRGGDQSARGWSSYRYQEKVPAISVASSVRTKAVMFWTCFSPEPVRGKLNDEGGRWELGGQELRLKPGPQEKSLDLGLLSLNGERISLNGAGSYIS